MRVSGTALTVVEHDHLGLVDDHVSGSRYRLSLLQGILCYRVLGGLVPVGAVIARHGVDGQVPVLLVMWAATVAVSVALWRVIQRRHLVQPRLVLLGLIVDTTAGVVFNLVAVLVVPGSVQDSFGDVFWFLAQVNVAAWTVMRPMLAPVSILGWSVVAWLMVVVDPERPSPVRWAAEVGFVGVHAVWLFLALATLVTAGRLIRLGSTHALSDGVLMGRRAAELQALRDTHDTVLQTLEAIALRAGDAPRDPAEELSAVGRMARSQAAELRHSLQEPVGGDDIRVMLVDLRQRFADRLDIELDFIDSGRVAQAPVQVWAALRGAVHECLTNVVKHSGVRQAFVQVDRTSAAIRVTVRDHGRGFLPEETPPGFGLAQSITQRLEEVGGRVEVTSVPGGGAVVSLTAPMERGAAAPGVGNAVESSTHRLSPRVEHQLPAEAT